MTLPATNTNAVGPMPYSFENTDHSMCHCDSQNLILAQEAEQYLQNGDPQVTGHVLLCLLLIIGLSAVRLGDSMLNSGFTVLCLSLARDLFPLEALGWTNT